MSFSLSEYTKIDVSWGLTPDHTRELTLVCNPLSDRQPVQLMQQWSRVGPPWRLQNNPGGNASNTL